VPSLPKNLLTDEMKKSPAHSPIGDDGIMAYHKIHIWQFPPTRTFVQLSESCRRWLFAALHAKYKVSNLLAAINAKSRTYGITRKYNSGHFWTWENGRKRNRGKVKSIRIPLWVLIEFSKLLSSSPRGADSIMRRIEKGIVCYAGTGKSTPVFEPKLPLRLTPELVSVIFHLLGDGHIGTGTDVSHYRQINGLALQNFIRKLHNSFGNFRETIVEKSKIIVPRIITDFYRHYFGLNRCRWDTARIPGGVKALRTEFLVAGLAAFIVDEGHIGDHIELYSSNYNLLSDLREIVQRLEYTTTSIHPRYRYGILNGVVFK
jgi:hypothetical protein